MTTDRDFKKIVRARMAKTNESYAAARAQLTKPRRGERFDSETEADGTMLFKMFTKLQTPEKGWSGLAVPSELLGLRRRVWLRGTLNGRGFWVSAQPMGDGNHWVTVNRQMRAEMGLIGDEEVEVEFTIASGPPALDIPDELRLALAARPDAEAIFDRMSHNHRKEYLGWIGQARREDTRARRIARMLDEIIETGGRSGR